MIAPCSEPTKTLTSTWQIEPKPAALPNLFEDLAVHCSCHGKWHRWSRAGKRQDIVHRLSIIDVHVNVNHKIEGGQMQFTPPRRRGHAPVTARSGNAPDRRKTIQDAETVWGKDCSTMYPVVRITARWSERRHGVELAKSGKLRRRGRTSAASSARSRRQRWPCWGL